MSEREIAVVAASDAGAVQRALADALAGGPIVLPRQEPGDAVSAAGLPADACLIIETSGSTGVPKRVVLTAHALRTSALATYERLDALAGRAGDFPSRQWLLCLPAHYIAGVQVLVRSLLAGTKPIELVGHFDADAFLAAAAQLTTERRYVSLVPVQLQRLVAAAEVAAVDAVMRGFDGILVGGQSTPRPVLEAARARGWRVVTTYGSSETSGGCVYNGEPLRGVRVRIVDGEIWLGGPMLASGYLDDEVRDAATFVERDGARWYRTTDAGELDAGPPQRIRVTGRLDHVIISGGEKVNLDVVERLAQQVPGCAEAVAVGAPSEEWGEEVVLVVPGTHEVSLDAVREACAVAGRAARPTRVVRIPVVPRLASGKPDRRALAALVQRPPEH